MELWDIEDEIFTTGDSRTLSRHWEVLGAYPDAFLCMVLFCPWKSIKCEIALLWCHIKITWPTKRSAHKYELLSCWGKWIFSLHWFCKWKFKAIRWKPILRVLSLKQVWANQGQVWAVCGTDLSQSGPNLDPVWDWSEPIRARSVYKSAVFRITNQFSVFLPAS